MPRTARTKLNSKYLHIMIQGLNKEYIFNEEREIKKYLDILTKNSENFTLKIIAYCVMNNHVHLLIYSPKIEEVSKFMSRVNTKYAKYYNRKHERCGYVFRNRYRSEEICTSARFINCIKYIHNNPVKARMCKSVSDYKYSSYNNYINKTAFVNEKLIQECFKNNGIDYKEILEENCQEYDFIEYDDLEEKERNKKQAIEKFLQEKHIKIDEIKENNKYLKDLALKLYFECNIRQKEIAEILGVNRLKIHRIIKRNLEECP